MADLEPNETIYFVAFGNVHPMDGNLISDDYVVTEEEVVEVIRMFLEDMYQELYGKPNVDFANLTVTFQVVNHCCNDDIEEEKYYLIPFRRFRAKGATS